MKSTLLTLCATLILMSCATDPYMLTAPEKYTASVSSGCQIAVENAELTVSARVEPSVPSLEQVIRVEACSRSTLLNRPLTIHVEEASCRFGRTTGLGSPAVRTQFELSYSLNGVRSDSWSEAGQGSGTGRELCDVYFWPLVPAVIDQIEQSIQ